MSSKSPTERIEELEQIVKKIREEQYTTGFFGIMMLDETLNQLEGERLLPSKTKWEIWRRVETQINALRAGCPKLADGARNAMPRQGRIIRAEAPKTHREKLRLRMRKPDADL